MGVTPSPTSQCGVVVHHWPSAARREDRASVWLIAFDTNTAACARVTGLSGEKVVAEVPAVIPR